MDGVILFEEVQGHNKTPGRVSFKILTGIFLVCLVINLLWQKGEVNGLTQGLFLGIVIFILINIFLNVKLVTQIRTDGIYVRYAPFQPSFSVYPWQSIEEVYIREYNALQEYGGWGVRISPLGKAFIASGNTGMQIILKDGSKVLIGTNRVEEMKMILKKMGW